MLVKEVEVVAWSGGSDDHMAPLAKDAGLVYAVISIPWRSEGAGGG